ncbi:hypothetical protein PYCCODRAFT_452815 [Trametes coccinea BRFM310]|uniref:Uncharacterized protein n=1 Tax=Trametes coccinea (strain BRFM310) TaxID=1353009 RepID=A0A1Y2IMK9_TRAC3|nr:hypothetical protein PYCCODRAFT_452815 [Trametes coccinea BRFM310]
MQCRSAKCHGQSCSRYGDILRPDFNPPKCSTVLSLHLRCRRVHRQCLVVTLNALTATALHQYNGSCAISAGSTCIAHFTTVLQVLETDRPHPTAVAACPEYTPHARSCFYLAMERRRSPCSGPSGTNRLPVLSVSWDSAPSVTCT